MDVFNEISKLSYIDRLIEKIKIPDLHIKNVNLDAINNHDFLKFIEAMIKTPNILNSISVDTFSDFMLNNACSHKLSELITISNTIIRLTIYLNVRPNTYILIAKSLYLNKSLCEIVMNSECLKYSDNPDLIYNEFVFALRLNPIRPIGSRWYLDGIIDSYAILKTRADDLGHPTLFDLLFYVYLGKN